MLPEFSLAGRVAVVTGGARGLGLEMMRALARAGADVVALDVLDDLARTAAEQTARDFGVRARSHRMDVTDAAEVDATIAAIDAEFGRIDVLVAAAGVANLAAAEDMSVAAWRRVIDINLTGVFLCAQAVGRRMLDRRRGSIILIASMSGQIVNRPQKQVAYNVSKAGVIMLTKSLAAEWAPRHVRVNALAPGYFRTAMTDELLDANKPLRDEWESLIPAGRMGTPSELGGSVVYLASDASSYMTGHTLVVDGGYTVW
jgi:NAD(P)-dependent dehydrogenase (short-subunit alcohol dehydrogenase family)